MKAYGANGDETNGPEHDPGYYLLSKGRPAFEKHISFSAPFRLLFNRAAAGTGMQGYLITLSLVGAFILGLPLLGVAKAGVTAYGLFLLSLLAIIPLSDVRSTGSRD